MKCPKCSREYDDQKKSSKEKLVVGVVVLVIALSLSVGLLWLANHRVSQEVRESEKYSKDTEKEMRNEARELEPLVYDYERLTNQLTTLPPNTPEYTSVESDLAVVTEKIIRIRPSFVKEADEQGNLTYEPIEELKEWVERCK